MGGFVPLCHFPLPMISQIKVFPIAKPPLVDLLLPLFTLLGDRKIVVLKDETDIFLLS